jgi:DNA invertase Pin-like site-specific DNA recombinase
VVAAVSVDRLGRSLKDLVLFIEELRSVGCDLYLDREALDTTSPYGIAMFQMAGVFAQLERSIIQGRVKAGMDRARKHGTKSGKPIGRTPVGPHRLDAVRAELAKGTGILKTARLAGVGTSVVQRIKREMAA